MSFVTKRNMGITILCWPQGPKCIKNKNTHAQRTWVKVYYFLASSM